MPQTATERKAAAKRSENAIALLKSDHAEVADLFEKYEKRANRLDSRAKSALAREICEALTIHATIEEEIFYPACKEHLEDAEDLLAEAKVEHQSLKELIGKIEGEKPGTDEFDAEVTVLGEYVKHHVKEEQNELFPKVRKSDMDLDELGKRLTARKSELQAR
jgi:hemerythrin-like domain-containing protein